MTKFNPASPGNTPSGGQNSASHAKTPNINIELLTEKVYKLMLADLNLQLRRSGGERR